MPVLSVPFRLVLYCAHLAQGAREADVWPQAGHHTAEVKVMMLQNRRWEPRRIWSPDLRLRIGIGEPLRKHAHHRIWLPVEVDLPAYDRRIPSEAALEEPPRKHNGGSVRTIFALDKRAPDDRRHPQQRKQVPAPAAPAHQLR